MDQGNDRSTVRTCVGLGNRSVRGTGEDVGAIHRCVSRRPPVSRFYRSTVKAVVRHRPETIRRCSISSRSAAQAPAVALFNKPPVYADLVSTYAAIASDRPLRWRRIRRRRPSSVRCSFGHLADPRLIDLLFLVVSFRFRRCSRPGPECPRGTMSTFRCGFVGPPLPFPSRGALRASTSDGFGTTGPDPTTRWSRSFPGTRDPAWRVVFRLQTLLLPHYVSSGMNGRCEMSH